MAISRLVGGTHIMAVSGADIVLFTAVRPLYYDTLAGRSVTEALPRPLVYPPSVVVAASGVGDFPSLLLAKCETYPIRSPNPHP